MHHTKSSFVCRKFDGKFVVKCYSIYVIKATSCVAKQDDDRINVNSHGAIAKTLLKLLENSLKLLLNNC